MEFRANDPGAVQFGNFINYYQFNSAGERLNLMPSKEFCWDQNKTTPNDSKLQQEPFLVLDIGCNSGDFTQLLYKFLQKQIQRSIIILGVDIDSILINRANENNKLQRNIFFKTVNMMTTDLTKIEEFLNSYHKQKFNAVFCLSITMWIHLNHSDVGLQKFLDDCSRISELLIIEPQPWKCYQTAVKRMKKVNETFIYFKELLWRTQVESEILNYLETKLKRHKVYETPPTKWNRKICFYRNVTDIVPS